MEATTKGFVVEQDAVNSDRALQENSLLDIVLFYFEGYEQKDPQYQLSDTLSYFRKLEPGPVFGRMLVKMAKLLRSHGHEADLVSWKDQVLLAESSLPESLEVALTTYEYQLNKRRYPQVVESARDFIKVYSKHGGKEGFMPLFTQAQKLLLDTAEGLQAIIIKNKGNEEAKPLSATLAAIYESFTRIVDDSDLRVPRVHYNLAETLFAIQDYEGATEHYRWVALRGEGDADASLKAIASRYEVLRLKQLADREIKARKLPADTTGDESQSIQNADLDKRLLQWIAWIDTHYDKYHSRKPADSEKIESFLFEADRALYVNGQTAAATQRLRKFAEKNPKSKFAIPAATLVVDTYIITANWEKTHELVLEFLEEKAWKGGSFETRLAGLAADSYFKVMEEKFGRKEYAQVLKDSGKFLKKYEKSERLPDGLRLAGQSALAIGDKLLAKHYFSRLIQERPKADGFGDALLARGSLAEENHEFKAAAADYSGFLGLSAESYRKAQTDTLRKKVLMLTWLAGNTGELRALLGNKAVCTDNLTEDCEKFEALVGLATPERSGSQEDAEKALKRAKAASGENRVFWALVGLEGAKHLEYRDRVYLIRQVASNWDDLESISKYAVLPQVSRSVARAFAFNRQEMSEIAPLRANERYIKRRVEVIREMENAATKAMNLPWVRIRAELLNEVAQLYLDFSKDLAKLPPPKNMPAEDIALYEDTVRKLVLPFEEKGQDLRRKAFELASKFAVEDDLLKKIVDPFFAENPSQAKSLKSSVVLPPPAELGLGYLSVLDPTGNWKVFLKQSPKEIIFEITQPEMRLKQLWVTALSASNWPQIAFVMSEAKDKKAVSDGTLSVMRAIALSRAGARAEGLLELDAARKDLSPESGNNVALTLIGYSARAYSKERISEWLNALKLEQLNQYQKNAMIAASAFIGVEIKKH